MPGWDGRTSQGPGHFLFPGNEVTMKAHLMSVAGLVLAVLAIVAMPSLSLMRAADNEPDVHRLDIFNGSVRTVHYYGKGLNAEESASLQELEQAQNDLAAARAARMTPQHREETGAAATPYVVPPLYFGDLLPAFLSNLNYALSDSAPVFPFGYAYTGYPAALPYTGWGYFGNPAPVAYTGPYFGYGSGSIRSAAATSPQVLNMDGNGRVRAAADEHEGAQEAPEVSVAEARKRLEAAQARVKRSERLSKALKLPEIVPAAEERANAPTVTVTMKNGATHKGRLIQENKDTVVVETATAVVEIRRNEVASVAREKPKKNP
jgi:hypothetical protein